MTIAKILKLSGLITLTLLLSIGAGSIWFLEIQAMAQVRQPLGIEFIVDMSGSMRYAMGNTAVTKAEAAKSQLLQILPGVGEPFAIRTFGWGPADPQADRCTSVLKLGFGQGEEQKGQARALIAQMNFVIPEQGSNTPLAAAFKSAGQDLFGTYNKQRIVVFTDGYEECGGDPIAVVRGLIALGMDVQIFIIGFDVDSDVQAQLQKVVEAAPGSQFIPVTKPEEIQAAAFRILKLATGIANIEVINANDVKIEVYFNTVLVGTVEPRTHGTFQAFTGDVAVAAHASGFNLWQRQVTTKKDEAVKVEVTLAPAK
jgi:hypothetical protein